MLTKVSSISINNYDSGSICGPFGGGSFRCLLPRRAYSRAASVTWSQTRRVCWSDSFVYWCSPSHLPHSCPPYSRRWSHLFHGRVLKVALSSVKSCLSQWQNGPKATQVECWLEKIPTIFVVSTGCEKPVALVGDLTYRARKSSCKSLNSFLNAQTHSCIPFAHQAQEVSELGLRALTECWKLATSGKERSQCDRPFIFTRDSVLFAFLHSSSSIPPINGFVVPSSIAFTTHLRLSVRVRATAAPSRPVFSSLSGSRRNREDDYLTSSRVLRIIPKFSESVLAHCRTFCTGVPPGRSSHYRFLNSSNILPVSNAHGGHVHCLSWQD